MSYHANSDGLWLHTKAWLVPTGTAPRAVVFLSHGLGEYCERYEPFVRFLNAAGIAVHAMDHQGHGRSEGERAHVEDFNHFVRDFVEFVDAEKAAMPAPLKDLPHFLFGHSMGGLIACHVAQRAADRFAGVVLSAPALAADPTIDTPLMRWLARVLGGCIPLFGLDRIPAENVSRSPDVVRNYANDPLIYHGPIRAGLGYQLLLAMNALEAELDSVSWPFLVLQGGQDRLVQASGSRALHDRARSTDKAIIEYPDLFHELLNEPEADRVCNDILSWLNARIAPTTV